MRNHRRPPTENYPMGAGVPRPPGLASEHSTPVALRGSGSQIDAGPHFPQEQHQMTDPQQRQRATSPGQRSDTSRVYATGSSPPSRRSLREEFHARPRQLITSQPRLVSAVYLDTQWTQALSESPIHVLVNPQRWACTRCSVVQQAFAIDAVNRIQCKRSGDEFFIHQGPPEVHHDQTMDGSIEGENLCCGWNLLTSGQSNRNAGQHIAHQYDPHASAPPVMRAFGCDWTPHGALACMIIADIVTLGCPCCPIGYLGCGSACFGLQTRWLIRKKYRIIGFGVEDVCIAFCCPQCAVEQQVQEMARQGVMVHTPEPCDMF
jgi:Cys-rich protein (TIGR01571 family)